MARAIFSGLYFRAMENKITPHARAWADAIRERQTNQPPCVLVVDDDTSMRQFNCGMLLRAGYRVNAAVDGAAAWDAINAGRYDLMVTDNHMPKLTGIGLLAKLHGSNITLPVIMATGVAPKEELIKNPWLRPAATLLKPYSVEDLLNTVKEVLLENGIAWLQTAVPPNGPSTGNFSM